MRRALLGMALITGAPLALSSPAAANSYVAASITASAGVRDSSFAGTRSAYGVHVHRGPRGHFPFYSAATAERRHGHDRYDYGYDGPYYEPGDYDANRSFDPDKWNDWWHERPERSFPRWVWRNQDCTEDRMWWSGAGWRCTP